MSDALIVLGGVAEYKGEEGATQIGDDQLWLGADTRPPISVLGVKGA